MSVQGTGLHVGNYKIVNAVPSAVDTEALEEDLTFLGTAITALNSQISGTTSNVSSLNNKIPNPLSLRQVGDRTYLNVQTNVGCKTGYVFGGEVDDDGSIVIDDADMSLSSAFAVGDRGSKVTIWGTIASWPTDVTSVSFKIRYALTTDGEYIAHSGGTLDLVKEENEGTTDFSLHFETCAPFVKITANVAVTGMMAYSIRD